MLRDKSLREQVFQKLTDRENGRLKKLSGDLDVRWQKLSEDQDTLVKRGTAISHLEQQTAALSKSPPIRLTLTLSLTRGKKE